MSNIFQQILKECAKFATVMAIQHSYRIAADYYTWSVWEKWVYCTCIHAIDHFMVLVKEWQKFD